MEQYSWDGISHSNLKKFVRELCIIVNKRTEKEHYAHDFNIPLNKASTEKMLRSKIQQLEQELEQTKKEKDIAVSENKNKIDELNLALLSIKTKIAEVIHYKQEKDKRLRNLERKIIKTIR